jgi:dTDP-4-amino-4,6-dideoxygalactose transaminase
MINVTKSDLPELEKYVDYLKRIWATRWLTNDGELLQLFQTKLQDYLGIKNLVLVNNGTLALHLALKVLGLKGEVITTPFTFAATTNVILWEGLTPVFVDIDPDTFNIDPVQVEGKITKRTSAILATHVYGNPCDVEELEKLARKHNLKVIYDAAHAFGVKYGNRSVLHYGDISTLSFHATKVFNTIEGGAIFAKDEQVLEKLKLLRNHGIKSEFEVLLPGTNAKMNEFQAAMGLCNLDDIDEKIELRRKIYEHYKEKLSDSGVKFQEIRASRYNYIYMPVCFESNQQRNNIYSELIENGIKPRKYFFPLTANFDYFKSKGAKLIHERNLPVASRIADRILCLPLYPDLEMSVVDRIVEIVKKSIA